jgi:hypothetical protein
MWRTPATVAVARTARRVRESRGQARVGRRREELGVGFIEEKGERKRRPMKGERQTGCFKASLMASVSWRRVGRE